DNLNEAGDYLAGFLSPLFFFWLVLGYFQQGRELKHQATELGHLQEQTKLLASQAALEYQTLVKEKQPHFSFAKSQDSGVEIRLTIANWAGPAWDCEIQATPDAVVHMTRQHILK